MMLDFEGQWSDLLATNNIMSIISGLRRITDNDEVDVEEIMASFSCWLQRTSEFTKKELLSLCFSRCHGLWMFLNRYSSRRVHNLLQKVRNLLTLVQWARRKLHSGHLWHGAGIPFVDRKDATNARHSCWTREHQDLKKHLWLGRLVEWWSLMGLLPKHPESQGEKQISHMWKEMSQDHQKAGLTESEMERCSSVIQGLVTHLVKQHGCLWTSEASGQQGYPPPSLKALLKLVLVPHVDILSVQAIIMYFILDMAKFLQCRNDLFRSFCHEFVIPSSFSQQIRAFWMLDRGQLQTSMELLLSPRVALPRFSWQHRCIIKSLLSRKEHQLALRYLHLTSPAMESAEDVKLCINVLLQNSCVSEAWTLVKRSHTESEDMVMHFLQACTAFGLSAQALKYIPAGYEAEIHSEDEAQFRSITEGCSTRSSPCPLSAKLYQAQKESAVSSEELLRLVTKAVTELRQARPKTLREFTWPQHIQGEATVESTEVFLSTEILQHRTPSPSILEMAPRNEDYNQPENPELHSSCPSPVVHNRRRVSFSSVSSLSPIRRDQTFSYESTVTLQQISALLIDDQEEEEELSQVSLAAEVFPDCHEWTLEGSTVPLIENTFTSHSFQNRFYSSECCPVLPALPEEMIQSPTTDSNELQNKPQQEECKRRQKVEELPCINLLSALSDASSNLLTDENQSSLRDKPTDEGAKKVVRTDTQAMPSLGPSLLHYMDFTKHKEDNKDEKLADKEYAAGRPSSGKVSVRSRRARKNKRVK